MHLLRSSIPKTFYIDVFYIFFQYSKAKDLDQIVTLLETCFLAQNCYPLFPCKSHLVIEQISDTDTFGPRLFRRICIDISSKS